jgi:hypothetical protein
MNDIALTGLLVTSPSAAFSELRERPRFWFPLLLIIVASIVQLAWYYSIVDIEWLKDHLFSGNARIEAMAPEAKAKMMSTMSQKTLMVSSIISTAIVLPIMFAIMSGYYMLAGKITNVQQNYKQWFSLVAWSALPALIGTVAALMILLTHGENTQLGQSDLQVLSANELFFQRTPSQPGYQFLVSLSIPTILSWVLSVIGVKAWSNRSWLFATVFVLLPVVIVYGIWAIVAFKG